MRVGWSQPATLRVASRARCVPARLLPRCQAQGGGQETTATAPAASTRQKKNPKDWLSLDELRAELEKPEEGVPGGIWSVLNFISQNSFGETSKGWGAVYRWFLNLVPTPRPRQGAAPDVTPELLQAARRSPLPKILLVSNHELAKMAAKFPEVLAMGVDEAALRLLGLKTVLPACDVSDLIIHEPRLYLGGSKLETEAKLSSVVSMMIETYTMPREVVYMMFAYDPGLPFVATQRGMQELRALWPEGGATLGAPMRLSKRVTRKAK
ncbi:hypothetical protein HYH03_009388 [Edaphochlamys debaryana]|uniref:Uncharacterized protein n=1 Tax=Edaphochlamys debaryana TaxID=47281 RepID=A0A836BX76_9CHLO|nr:hypothetical protein HYH03_009388 [Edaphochlamys debaryana]|eukprot:KAG2492446.1 hypothetical protein HYH03_009388 [Edaphochlamys debaryana]